MRPGTPCRHCTKQGCAIYETRPENPCVQFHCGWLEDDRGYPDEMRPDRSGVIVILGREWRNWKVILAIPVGRSVPAESIEWLRAHARESGMPLVFHERLVTDGKFTGAKALAYGSPAFANAVKYSVGPEDVIKM